MEYIIMLSYCSNLQGYIPALFQLDRKLCTYKKYVFKSHDEFHRSICTTQLSHVHFDYRKLEKGIKWTWTSVFWIYWTPVEIIVSM